MKNVILFLLAALMFVWLLSSCKSQVLPSRSNEREHVDVSKCLNQKAVYPSQPKGR